MQSTWFCFIQAVWCLATSAREVDGRCWLCCLGLPDGLHQAWSALTQGGGDVSYFQLLAGRKKKAESTYLLESTPGSEMWDLC